MFNNSRIYCTKVTFVSFFCFVFTVGVGLAGQIDFGTYLQLEKGMSEGEVLFRAGVPDKEIYFDSEAQRTAKSIKQLLYIPGPEEGDPHLTIITIQRGEVLKIERITVFSSKRNTIGGQIDLETYNRLKIGMSEGEVLIIAGAPDKEVYIGDSVKQLLYIPRPEQFDPHLTVITTTKGKVINIERTKILSR